MKTGKKVIIIGAGIGGLSAAIQLAYKGFLVNVFEKQKVPGGKIIQFEKNGFTFDGGASFITLSNVYDDFFSSVDRKREDYIQWQKMEQNTTFHFANGKSFILYSDVSKVRNEIKKHYPEDIDGFEQFMQLGKNIYELLYEGPQYAKRNYHKFYGFDYLFNLNIFTHLKKLQVHRSWKQVIEMCFKNPELQAIFSYQATFMGMKPSEALGTYIFLPWANIQDGMYAVKGGTYGIVKGFYKLACELGVKFHFEQEITRLNIKDKHITHVISNSSTNKTDIVVNNSDPAYFYTRLIPTEKNTYYSKSQLKKIKHTNSYFTINLGLKKPLKKLHHHTFMISEKWEEFFDLIFKQNAVTSFNKENLCYYIIQPSITETWMAPPGKATAFILIPVCGYDPDVNWTNYEQTFKNMIYDCIEQRDGVQLRDLIEIEEIYSPERWGNQFNLWENIILGFSLNFFQINNFRMPNKAREFDNLYHVGGSTIPGPGVPTCITSGELVTQRILEKYGK